MRDATHATTFTLPSDREIVVSRFFDAPRDLVWKAWMQPPPHASVDSDYVEIVEPERVVRAFRMQAPLEGKLVVETVTFEAHGGRTKVTAASRFDSKEDRDKLRQQSLSDSPIERLAGHLDAMT